MKLSSEPVHNTYVTFSKYLCLLHKMGLHTYLMRRQCVERQVHRVSVRDRKELMKRVGAYEAYEELLHIVVKHCLGWKPRDCLNMSMLFNFSVPL